MEIISDHNEVVSFFDSSLWHTLEASHADFRILVI